MKIRSLAARVLLAMNQASTNALWIFWQQRLGSLGKDSKLSRTMKLYVPRQVHIGERVSINDFVHIWGGGQVHIGSDTLIAAHVVITSQTHDIDAPRKHKLYSETDERGPVKIGSNVWIGSNATVLPGVSIGDGAVVGAGAVVTKDVPPYHLALGCPARIVRSLK